MNWSRISPWTWLRGKSPAYRANSRPSPLATRLSVDILEDRLVPSTSTFDAAHELWRQQTFTVDDAAATAAVSTPTNASFGSLIGLPTAFENTPYRGTGYTVAVIDTGIDYRHPDLGNGFGVNARVVGGWDFVNNDADPMDDNGHGTHVAGIIGGSSATYSGVAPNVNLVGLKVLGATGTGSFGAVEDALNWVIANRTRFNIVAINLSLGSGNYTTSPYTFLDDEFSTLKAGGVFISVASGNSFYSNNSAPGVDFPAVHSNVVSVGAVWNGNFGSVAWGSGARDFSTAPDRVTSFSQRGAGLSIMAPGALITSTYLNGAYQSMAGTSMASPVVAGASVLIHQAMDARGLAANQDSILAVMKSTGVNVIDGDDENDNVVNTGLTYKRLDLGAAITSIARTNTAPVLQPITGKTASPGSTTTIPLYAADSDGDIITYSARVIDGSQQATQLRAQLGLTYAGSYFQNIFGQNEKWMTGTGGVWYCILPSGQVRRWAGSMPVTLQAANLVATLDVKYYANPNLLLSSQSPSAANLPTVSTLGNQLKITTPAAALGSYQIEVTASDGKLTSVQSFTLTINSNTAPRISLVATQSMLAGRTQTIALAAKDDQNNPITYSVKFAGTYGTPPATLVLVGNQLTIHASPDITGSFDVTATASDGSLSTSTTFRVNVTAAPVAQRFTGDFNADGKQDAAIMNSDGAWWLTLAANGSFTNQSWGQWAAASTWVSIQTGDFNGDGKTDIIGFGTSGVWTAGLSTGSVFNFRLWAQWSAASNWNAVSVGDTNGDGKTDIIGFMNTGSWWVGTSSGSTFAGAANWAQWSAAGNWSGVRALDVDGDGKLDIVGMLKSTGKWYVGISTGTTFSIKLWTGNP